MAEDLRRTAPHCASWGGVELSAEHRPQPWTPPGFAHGFLVHSDQTQWVCKTTDCDSPADARALVWDDPDLAIAWPLAGEMPQISAKDAQASAWADCKLFDSSLQDASALALALASTVSARRVSRRVFNLAINNARLLL